MTILALLRMFGALAIVLGLLAGSLWAVRRFNLRLPGRIGGGGVDERRLAVVERLSVDPKRSLLLVRRDNVEHLVLMAPEGNVVLTAPRPEAPELRPELRIARTAAPQPVAALPSFDAEAHGTGDIGSTAFLGNLHRIQNFASARLARHA
ncbi:FliO/MopB family protein [Sphingomonas suaedae]|uniref:FliO/MopB family protein n=1 Tax=Sphingomonas suaedae TaxID=2599297 RepID=A0A518REA7_9SPHN|nr:flagellar biosynthetic protein FliO [Sphingomonas suaedae]QDX25786.1 FliO/MopB family protein [Sphingomonas suaedae]